MRVFGLVRATSTSEAPKIVDVIRDIGNDMKTIAADELELSRRELGDYLERLIVRAAFAVVGALVAIIGFGMLCIVVVAALEPVIDPLWLRLLIMAAVYLAIGSGVTWLFFRRVTGMRGPDLQKQISEIGETADAISNGLQH